MAKRIQISNDDGSTWSDLPSPQGGLSFEAEQIDDTILGQTFRSNEVGLIAWNVSASGIYKGYAGYLATLREVGSSTSATGEAMSLVSGQTYRVTDVAREIWDRAESVTVRDGAVDVTDEVEHIDYLFGRVTFKASYSVQGAVTVDVNYFPLVTLGRGNSYNLTMSAEPVDESNFPDVQANGGFRIYSAGLRTVALEVGGIFVASTDAKDKLAQRSELIVEVDPTGTGASVCRGFFKLTGTAQSGQVGALEEETLTFSLAVPDEVENPRVAIPFSWKHSAGTTLNLGIRHAIHSWLNELNTYDVRYLPSGDPGQTPLDGIRGDVVFTDISLQGGLSDMNVFSMEMQGNGPFTEV